MATSKTISRDAVYIAGTAGVIWLLWWVWQRTHQPIPQASVPSQEGFPIPYGQPMDNVYNANPNAFEPPTNADLTVNVNNPYVSMLDSAYMPLFGFVGIAQGVEL